MIELITDRMLLSSTLLSVLPFQSGRSGDLAGNRFRCSGSLMKGERRVTRVVTSLRTRVERRSDGSRPSGFSTRRAAPTVNFAACVTSSGGTRGYAQDARRPIVRRVSHEKQTAVSLNLVTTELSLRAMLLRIAPDYRNLQAVVHAKARITGRERKNSVSCTRRKNGLRLLCQMYRDNRQSRGECQGNLYACTLAIN